MERIGLHNYEAFFLDYLEGNLNAQEEFELLDFLEKNPELKADLDFDLNEVILIPTDAAEVSKHELKKQGIQAGEVDELMIASIEGQLSEEEERELARYVQSKGLSKTFAYYKNTILLAAATDVYGDTSDLKKKSGVIIPLFYRVAAAAAVIILLIGISIRDNGATPVNDGVGETTNSSFAMTPKSHLPRIEQNMERGFEVPTGINHEYVYGNQMVDNQHVIGLDTTKEEDSYPIQPLSPDDIVHLDSVNKILPNKNVVPERELIPDDIAINESNSEEEYITEEPIKAITNLAGGLFNRDISYSRDKQKSTNGYVAHHFKLGRFEFERKKH